MPYLFGMVASYLAMSESSASVEVSLGRQGRLVIPAPLRRSLGLEEGDRLVARQEADRRAARGVPAGGWRMGC